MRTTFPVPASVARWVVIVISLTMISLGWMVVLHGMTEHHSAVRQCITEDDRGPCYWDASTQGNHHGRSFYADGTDR